eukprot:5231020-Pyramimonas_sp.AAC.1
MGQGRSSLDNAWRHSVEAERATGDKVCWASLLWDLKQFYEHIGHQELIKQGIISGFPMHEATYEAKAFMWNTIMRGREYPGTRQGLHDDDLSLHSWHISPVECAIQLKALA